MFDYKANKDGALMIKFLYVRYKLMLRIMLKLLMYIRN